MVVLPAQEYSMIRSKECFKCKTVKPLEEFYKHSMMADGHVNKCKVCNKKDVIKHRLKNIERIREYDRQRGKLPERKRHNAVVNQAWRAEDRRRTRAHNAVSRAISKGILARGLCCRCGSAKTLAHHDDYDKPLDVMWLCQPCHKQRHKELKEEF
jgi:ribosomal protein S27AE